MNEERIDLDSSPAMDSQLPSKRLSLRRILIWIGGIGVLLFGVVGLGIWLNSEHVSKPRALDTRFSVASGASLVQIIRKLESQGIIDCGICLRIHQRLFGPKGPIKAGEYELSGNLSPLAVVNKFIVGEVMQFRVTLVEGRTLEQWLQWLWQHTEIKRTLKGDTRDELYKQVQVALDLEQINPEGLFLPETYVLRSGDTDVSLLRRAHRLQRQVLDKIWQERQENLPIKTPYEAVILASIIEKETGAAIERPIISGVFVNRLRKGMRLETDPTVIYGIKNYDGNITRKHLRTPSLYNTYVIAGLPPTPIAAPSRAALQAAVQPETTDAIFFVAKGDGSHQFSKTLREHNAAVKQYQLKRAAQYRSAPGS